MSGEEETPNRQSWDDDSLEASLTSDHLKELRSKFLTLKQTSNQLLLDDFTDAISEVMKTNKFEEESKQLFDKISKTQGEKRFVTWNAFLDHLIKHIRASNLRNSTAYPSLHSDYNVKLLTHNRRDPTVKVLSIAASSFIYVFLSKLGVVGILDRKLQLQKTYVVDLDDLERNYGCKTKRICKAWATDAVHMQDCKKLVIGSTSRTLHFYDISAATHMEEFRVFGLPNQATCFEYWWEEEEKKNGGSMLLFGDDVGNIHCFHFQQPKTLLFKKPDMEGLTRVFFMDLEQHKHFATYTVLEKVHNDAVVRLQYVPHNQCLVSCSQDAEKPLVIRHIMGKIDSYVFTPTKGMQCFDFHRPLNLLVTGSRDCLVRFWNPYVVSQPVAILSGHQMAVLDTRIMPERHLVISYSRDMVLKTWSLLRPNCLQTILLKFPIAQNPRTVPEHGQFPIHLQTFHQNSILVTCHDYVAQLKLSEDKDAENQVRIASAQELSTYDARLSAMDIGQADSDSAAASDDQSEILPKATDGSQSRIMLSETEALNEFGTYIFAKMSHLKEGHMSRKEMRKIVGQGLAYRALGITDLSDVHIDPNLPMSERMRNRGLAYANETDFRSLNLNFASSPLQDDRLSSRSSLSSNAVGWPTVTAPHQGPFPLPIIRTASSTLSSRCPSRNRAQND